MDEEQIENYNFLTPEEQEVYMYQQWLNSWHQDQSRSKKAYSLPPNSSLKVVSSLATGRPLSGDPNTYEQSNWVYLPEEYSPEEPKSIDFQDPAFTVSIEEELSSQNLYKTELCRSWKDFGTCRYGHKCQFAHGEYELRVLMRHPKYKTEDCKTFTSTGYCPYGERCRFIHPEEKKANNLINAFPGGRNIAWAKSWSPQSLDALTSIPPFVPKNQQQQFRYLRNQQMANHDLGDFSADSFSTKSSSSDLSTDFLKEEEDLDFEQPTEGRSRLAIFQTFSERMNEK